MADTSFKDCESKILKMRLLTELPDNTLSVINGQNKGTNPKKLK